MDPRVEKFINGKKDEIKKKELEKRQKILIKAGLYEKEYSKNFQYSSEYPYTELNNLGQAKYYRIVPINITDEEYEEVKKYVTCNKKVEKNMFDEKNFIWISIYKVVTIITFFAFILFGMVAGIGDLSSEFLDLDLGGDTFFDFVIWFLAGGFVGFIQLVLNMLVIQFLNNVQIIREKLEKN